MKYSILFSSLSVGFAVHAQSVISFNVDVYGTISGSSQSAGVVSAANWNDTWLMNGNANGGAGITWNNLVDNSGANTGMSVSYVNYLNGWQYYSIQGSAPGQDGSGTYSRNLLNGYFNDGASNDAGGADVGLSAIPFGTYDLIVYFSSDAASRAGTVSVGGTTYDFSTLGASSISGTDALFTQTTDMTGGDPGADYAVFSGLSGSTQTINVNIPNWGGLTGFQIVELTPAPEPGTVALAVLGGLGLVFARRRR